VANRSVRITHQHRGEHDVRRELLRSSNMTVTENVFVRGGSGKCGVYGPTNSLNGVGRPNGNVWSGNVYTDGAVIPRPEE
jgi:hypothetical protein